MKNFYVTVDVEEDFPPYLTNSYIGIQKGIPRLLNCLRDKRVFSTFFVTGEIALKFPKIVSAILEDGHEIGCHSFTHKPLAGFQLSSVNKQKVDIEKATRILEKLMGRKPTLFRSPEFSVNNNTFKVLEDLGYRLDSSVLPGRRKLRMLSLICNHFGAPEYP